MPHRTLPRLSLLALAVAQLMLVPALAAEPAGAANAAIQRTYDIPAGPLEAALNRFGHETGITLSFSTGLSTGLRSPGLQGSHDLAGGLARLLQGTGLAAQARGDGSYILYRLPAASGETVLTPMTVTAGADRSGTTEGTGSYTTHSTNTATGLALSPRETPQSVSVITSQRIEDQALTDFNEVLRNMPGVAVKAQDRGRGEYFARGFGVSNFQVDGIPVIASGIQSDVVSTAIYDRFEVVRGANGLMSGAGNPSASINMVRKHANSKIFTGHIALEGGSWDRYGGMVDLSTPLNQEGSLRGRAVINYRNQNGFMDFEERQTAVYYFALDADLGSATRLSLGISDQRDDRNGTYWGGLPMWYADGTRTHWSRSTTTAAKWHQWDIHTQNVFASLEHAFDNGWLVKVDGQYTDSDEISNLLWFSSARPDRETGLGMSASPLLYDKTARQSRFNVQASGPFDLLGRTHEMTVGTVYTRTKYALHMPDQIGSPAPVGNFNQWDGNYPEPVYGPRYFSNSELQTQTAGYAAVRLNPADPLKIIAGVRVTRYERDNVTARGASTSELNESAVFTPYAGVLYDLNDWLTAYASYTSIFQPQSSLDRSGKTLDPLEGNSYEAGLKGEFFGGALNASAAVFRIEQDNFAVPDGDAQVPGTGGQAYRGERGIVSEGYELELVGQINPQWDIGLSWAQFLARNPDGQRVSTRFPTRMLKLFTKYELTGALSGWSIGGGVDWQGDMPHIRINPVTGNAEDVGQSAYALINLMARYQISKPLAVQFNVYNLFDKKYYENSWSNSVTYGEPRRVSVNMKYTF
ncbi:TonB-dependent siderophore receptor [Thauera sp. Sel9]|uniref:TonB-dependent siderophore receptor n=1 Tax=Thauera sp. Sel9 TaxID=2974299 RepID=UPI0021E12EA8|nr:TonB-dependent siderophore receptor [Thauera sp. Sel9]MCV2216040.1 TonB-dependent siderophore receptor [Thauera sp. Sel9]